MPKPKAGAKFTERVAESAGAHPRWTWSVLASIAIVLTAIGALGAWAVGLFVFKSDFIAFVKHQAMRDEWHDVGHVNLRVDRLGDEVDRMRIRKAYSQGKLSPQDEAEAELWQKKLDAAAAALVDAQRTAKSATKETP